MTQSAAIPIPRAQLASLDARLAQLASACRASGVVFYDDAGVTEHLRRVLLVSDFAYDSFLRDPALLGSGLIGLMSDPRPADARAAMLRDTAPDDAAQLRALRRFRRREALRLIWRDVNGLDDVPATLAGASVLAEICLQTALVWSERALAVRHGVPLDAQGRAQRLVVFGLGKLGGGELNFSSDIDLILAYPENGQSDGARALDNEAFFARLGQQLVRLLAEVTADGYVYRVDLRLRPFGGAGRVALSFAAMEQYYQREGRDWERYAWIKARPVAGDLAAGERLIETLRPFVYRRYFDYTAYAGLREMKALIDAEVARKDMAEHIKLGPGGIREIEFIVQLLQLIRGGREPSLRVRGLLPALTACEQRGLLARERAGALRAGYLFLRRVENRLQMLRDEQTHALPEDPAARARLAAGLGFADWTALAQRLAAVRQTVSHEFAALMAPARSVTAPAATPWPALWQRLRAEEIGAEELAGLGYSDAEALLRALAGLLHSPTLRAMSTRARERLDRLMPALLAAAAASHAPAPCLERLLRLVHAIARRSAYIALLDEQPGALKRVVALFAESTFLAERVIEHPLLLDDLFDVRLEQPAPARAGIAAELQRRLDTLEQADAEAEIELLQEEKHSAGFRLGLAWLGGRADAVASARGLSELAEAIVATVLRLAERDFLQQYGRLQGYTGAGTGLGVLGYGSLGGAELGFSSDLDLVFVYDGALAQRESSGPKVLDGMRYYARIAQRVVHLLTTLTRAGRLYEIDVRLRPDGAKGLLVTSLQAFSEYQRERAWTWEHQALVRARVVAGDLALAERFADVRQAILTQPRDPAQVHAQVGAMRARWRAGRDRSSAALFDLKQGAGGLVDIEFLLQAQVLLHAARLPALLSSGNSATLIDILGASGVLTPEQATALAHAHAALLGVALSCTLDARARIASRSTELEAACASVLAVARALGLELDGAETLVGLSQGA